MSTAGVYVQTNPEDANITVTSKQQLLLTQYKLKLHSDPVTDKASILDED